MSASRLAKQVMTPGLVPITTARECHSVIVPYSDGTNTFHETFVVDTRYVGLEYVGGGAYGVVAKATDTVLGVQVAIKKIPDALGSRSLNDSKRILRELILLRHLGGHENITWIQDIMLYPNHRDFKDVYIVIDLMEGDLGGVVASNQTLSDAQMKYFIYQLLRGLKYVHTAGVLHRDLKPQNVLVNSDCSLKVTDFGLGRAIDEDSEDQDMTPYVVTRWYRAPELLLDFRSYGPAVDVWSVGCILAELLGRKPLFCGKHFAEQLKIIVTVLGTPTDEELSFVTNAEMLKLLRSWKRKPKVPFIKLYPRANPLALDLLNKLLVFDPRKRCTVEEALEHPYLAEFRHPDTELAAPRRVVMDFEGKGKLPKRELQRRMLREMAFFHPDSNEQLRLSGSDGLVSPHVGTGAGAGSQAGSASAGRALVPASKEEEGHSGMQSRAKAGLAALGATDLPNAARLDPLMADAVRSAVSETIQREFAALLGAVTHNFEHKLAELEDRLGARLTKAEEAIHALRHRAAMSPAQAVGASNGWALGAGRTTPGSRAIPTPMSPPGGPPPPPGSGL